MDLSSIRTALNGFSGATPVMPASTADTDGSGAFLLGAQDRVNFSNNGTLLDLNNPAQLYPEVVDDFAQDDLLAIDFAAGEAAPALSLYYNANFAATEVRLDGITVAVVRMREGHGPLRAAAITLAPDASLCA
jgi:hypothetical protein